MSNTVNKDTSDFPDFEIKDRELSFSSWTPDELEFYIQDHGIYTFLLNGTYGHSTYQGFGGYSLDEYCQTTRKRMPSLLGVEVARAIANFLKLDQTQINDIVEHTKSRKDIKFKTLNNIPNIYTINTGHSIIGLVKEDGVVFLLASFFQKPVSEETMLAAILEKSINTKPYSNGLEHDRIVGILKNRLDVITSKNLLEKNMAPAEQGLGAEVYKI